MITFLTHQPDDPGPDDFPVVQLVYGARFTELTPATLRLIRKNAGKVSALTLAQALCWRIKRLQKIARAHGIDLRFHHNDNEAEPRGA